MEQTEGYLGREESSDEYRVEEGREGYGAKRTLLEELPRIVDKGKG